MVKDWEDPSNRQFIKVQNKRSVHKQAKEKTFIK